MVREGDKDAGVEFQDEAAPKLSKLCSGFQIFGKSFLIELAGNVYELKRSMQHHLIEIIFFDLRNDFKLLEIKIDELSKQIQRSVQ